MKNDILEALGNPERIKEIIMAETKKYQEILQKAILIECPTHENFSDVCGALSHTGNLRIFNSGHEDVYQCQKGYICVRLVKK